MTVTEMIKTHPASSELDAGALATCIEACLECSATCTSCADACLHEDGVAELRRCISLNADCADVCQATAHVLSRIGHTDRTSVRALLEACAAACDACGEECGSHAEHHEHCRVCADACRRCAEACRSLLAALG